MGKDLFSTQSADYASYQPSYPVELIDYIDCIVSFVKQKDLAWDCATGNGQAVDEMATQLLAAWPKNETVVAFSFLFS